MLDYFCVTDVVMYSKESHVEKVLAILDKKFLIPTFCFSKERHVEKPEYY